MSALRSPRISPAQAGPFIGRTWRIFGTSPAAMESSRGKPHSQRPGICSRREREPSKLISAQPSSPKTVYAGSRRLESSPKIALGLERNGAVRSADRTAEQTCGGIRIAPAYSPRPSFRAPALFSGHRFPASGAAGSTRASEEAQSGVVGGHPFPAPRFGQPVSPMSRFPAAVLQNDGIGPSAHAERPC